MADFGTLVRIADVHKFYSRGNERVDVLQGVNIAIAKGDFLANAALASRKDARDAVVAARSAQSGWAGATAYNRTQVLYRIAEMLEGRRAQFVDELVESEGITAAVASWTAIRPT